MHARTNERTQVQSRASLTKGLAARDPLHRCDTVGLLQAGAGWRERASAAMRVEAGPLATSGAPIPIQAMTRPFRRYGGGVVECQAGSYYQVPGTIALSRSQGACELRTGTVLQS